MAARSRQRRRADAKEWSEARRAEAALARRLRGLARRCGEMASTIFEADDFQSSAQRLSAQLEAYGRAIRPWALALAQRSVEEVARRDRRVWARRGREMGRALHREIESAPTGEALRRNVVATAALITSLPLEAAQRVNEIAVKAMVRSGRADELAREIMRTGHVTKSRANLIARTQTSTCASELVKVRAQHVGSEGYIWRTVGDADVRDLHRRLEGTYHRWDDPPVAGERGERAHAGQIYNCFVGSTLVRPVEGLLRAFRAPYRGDLVILRAGDATIEVTPNHPILTPRGWVAAGLIEAGDYLICMAPQRARRCENKVNNGLVPIEQIFESLRSDRESDSAWAVLGFYGDVINQEVEIVRTELSLSSNLSPWKRARQNSIDELVAGADCRVPQTEFRGPLEIGEAGAPSVGNVGNILLARPARCDQSVGLSPPALSDVEVGENFADSPGAARITSSERGSASASLIEPRDLISGEIIPRAGWWDAGSVVLAEDPSRSQMLAQRVRADSELARDIFDCAPAEDKFCRVLDKRIRSFFGHVYTLETVSGWYPVTHTGIVAKNCRCYPEVVLPDEPSA